MVISKETTALLNYRIEQEEASSRLYQSMSVWLEYNGFSGAASLWKKYADEELVHAGFSYDYLLDLNIKPIVPQLEKPTGEFKNLPQIIALSLQHELDITEQCKELAQKVAAQGDYMTLNLAQKYLNEQVEELKKTQYWVDRLELFGSEGAALRLLDEEMGEA
jgi:ferritin